MTFRDLLPGQTFVFVSSDGHDVIRWGSKGPFVKLSAATYTRLSLYQAGRWNVLTTSTNARVRAVKQEANQ